MKPKDFIYKRDVPAFIYFEWFLILEATHYEIFLETQTAKKKKKVIAIPYPHKPDRKGLDEWQLAFRMQFASGNNS
jgi:hypothetical protein